MTDFTRRLIQERNAEDLRALLKQMIYGDPSLFQYSEELQLADGWLYETHRELTAERPMEQWNEAYWERVLLDLQMNFSKKRLQHAIAVGSVVKKDTVATIEQNTQKKPSEEPEGPSAPTPNPNPAPAPQPDPPKPDPPANPPQPPPEIIIREPEEARKARLKAERLRLAGCITAAAMLVILVLWLVLR